jgi:hypothetical protein
VKTASRQRTVDHLNAGLLLAIYIAISVAEHPCRRHIFVVLFKFGRAHETLRSKLGSAQARLCTCMLICAEQSGMTERKCEGKNSAPRIGICNYENKKILDAIKQNRKYVYQ